MQYERNPKDTQPHSIPDAGADLRAHNTTYDWRMLFMLVLMGLGSGRTNVLAVGRGSAGLAAGTGLRAARGR